MKNLPISVTLMDALGNEVVLEGSDHIRLFLESEIEAWAWLDGAPHSPVDMSEAFLLRLTHMLDWVDNFEHGDWDEGTLRSNLQNLYAGSQPVMLFSTMGNGAAVNLVQAEQGTALAERVLALVTGKKAFVPGDLEDFRAWSLLALPGRIHTEAWVTEQQRRLGNAKNRFADEISKFRNRTAEFESIYVTASADDRARYKRLATKAFVLAAKRANAFRDSADEKIELMNSTRVAYEEQMRLKAPVEYWSEKGEKHDASALRWGTALAVYVVGAVLIGTWVFFSAWESLGTDTPLSSRHLLLVAAIGAVLTLLFWGARLCVRIFLGERHLFTDAEERRVMTQAYLALIKEQAASDQERMLILAALFRNAQDGIVKDDGGGGELSLPAVLAKMLDGGKAR